MILPQFGEGRSPTGVFSAKQPMDVIVSLNLNFWNHSSNKDEYLGSFYEMFSNRVSLNTRKLHACAEEVLESKMFLVFHRSRSFSSSQRTLIYILRETWFLFPISWSIKFGKSVNTLYVWFPNHSWTVLTCSMYWSQIKFFDFSLINYDTFLFHSALSLLIITLRNRLLWLKELSFTDWRCDRLLDSIPVQQDWLSRAPDYSCHETILYSFGYFKRANFNWSIIQQNFEFDNWHPFNFTYLFCNLSSRVNLAFVHCKTFRKIVWRILRRQLLRKWSRPPDFDRWLIFVYAVYK